MGRSNKCAVYVSVVAKTSSGCFACFAKNALMILRRCSKQQIAADVQKNIIQSVVEQMSDTNCKLEMSVETKSLEDKINATGSIGQESTMRP